MSKVPPVMVIDPESFNTSLAPSAKVPAVIVVPPLYVFAPLKVKRPAPALVSEAVADTDLSLMMPVMVLVPALVTLKLPCNVMAAAVSTSVLMVMPVNGVVPPTAPVKVVSPVPLVVTLSVCAPSTVLPNTTSPFDVVLMAVLSPKFTASL